MSAHAYAGSGAQWLMNFHGCEAAADLLNQAGALEKLFLDLVAESGLQAIHSHFHQFEPQGVTGAVLLSESHLTVHTWPEARFAALDLYVCDHTMKNGAKGEKLCRMLVDALQPADPNIRKLVR